MHKFFRPGDHRPIARAIYDRLVKEQEKRPGNPNWQESELNARWEETNKQRAILGKGPIALEEVRMAEMQAMGHVDYVMKCAYYLEELVVKP